MIVNVLCDFDVEICLLYLMCVELFCGVFVVGWFVLSLSCVFLNGASHVFFDDDLEY